MNEKFYCIIFQLKDADPKFTFVTKKAFEAHKVNIRLSPGIRLIELVYSDGESPEFYVSIVSNKEYMTDTPASEIFTECWRFVFSWFKRNKIYDYVDGQHIWDARQLRKLAKKLSKDMLNHGRN